MVYLPKNSPDKLLRTLSCIVRVLMHWKNRPRSWHQKNTGVLIEITGKLRPNSLKTWKTRHRYSSDVHRNHFRVKSNKIERLKRSYNTPPMRSARPTSEPPIQWSMPEIQDGVGRSEVKLPTSPFTTNKTTWVWLSVKTEWICGHLWVSDNCVIHIFVAVTVNFSN